MMALSRFEALAASYGADLNRWPAETRDAARALLAVSTRAQAVLDAERDLDAAILSAGVREADRLRPTGGEDAALARLRADVAARIVAGRQPARPGRSIRWLEPLRRAWQYPASWRMAGLATAGCFAVMAGLLVGVLSMASPESDALLAELQPVPVAILAQ